MASSPVGPTPRARSRLSFTSNKNRKSSSSFSKMDFAAESAKEKAQHQLHSKADPTKAINEVQPATLAHEQQSTLMPLRAIEHRDLYGNVITDPDRSNPTRPRLERPLDTIRSFEAAIDMSYNKRPVSMLGSVDALGSNNRRSGLFQGYNPPKQNGDGTGFYGNRANSMRPDSYYDHPGPPGHQYGQGRRFGPRFNSEPIMYSNNPPEPQEIYPSHDLTHSYDTVVSSGYGSHGTDQWGNSTDPSSENSSIDRVQPPPKQDLAEAYGFSGFGGGPQLQGPILEELGHGAPTYGQPGYGQEHTNARGGHPFQGSGTPPSVPPHVVPPHVPPKEVPAKGPIKLGKANLAQTTGDGVAEKRKSWIKRRFSKSN